MNHDQREIEIENLRCEVARWEDMFIKSQSQLAEREVTITRILAEREHLSEELDEARKMMAAHRGVMASLQVQLASAKSLIERLRKEADERDSEIESAQSQLRERNETMDNLEADNKRLKEQMGKFQDEIARLANGKDFAYVERDRLVCALSKVFPSSLERHPDDDKEWENDWRWIVLIDLPTGQATWHIHDSELPWFHFLKLEEGPMWDGHSSHEKYERIHATLK